MSADERQLVDQLADFLEELGAPLSLIVDWIILMDNSDWFAGVAARRRNAILQKAKRETARRYIAQRIDDACWFVDADEDIEPARVLQGKKAAVLADMKDAMASREQMRKYRQQARESADYKRIRDRIGKEHGSDDCFDEDLEAQYLRVAREELPEVFGPEPSAASGKLGTVYLISLADPTLVKIGFTTKLRHRMRAFRTATPAEVTIHLTIDATRGFEAELHRRFDAYRVGREWFHLSPEIEAFIAAEKAKGRKP